MKIKQNILILFTLLHCTVTTMWADNLVSHFTMQPNGYKVKDEVNGASFRVSGNFMPEATPGAKGSAMRFDGYTTYVDATIDVNKLNNQSLTFSLWSAMETYPMMVTDAADNQYTYIAGNMDGNSGFAFTLSSQGDYAFEFYANGGKVTCKGDGKFPKYEWVNLKAIVSVANGMVILYRNTEKVGSVSFRGNLNIGNPRFIIGRSWEERKMGPCYLNTINGIIDDIQIFSDVVSGHGYTQPENTPNLAVSQERFAGNNVQRPQFHGMPSANWTNETHGLIHYNGKYHVFFQKNGNGPYMSRLHWGHISSTNLIDWEEDPIAFGPSEWYDIKGTWSGCIYKDDYLTGGKPHIYYTAVDNGRASIAEAMPTDDDLIRWDKNTANPIISNRPDGLSSDFRDCYIFCSKGEYYMIVGTSKDDRGAATLHYFDKNTRTWSNNGKIFFQSNNANISGTFWEMPVIIPMGDKWVFMATPLGSARQGVEVLYWVGDINDDGTFTPLSAYKNEPKELELGSFGKDGYGLLSPSITQHNGKTIAMGIVPDKLSLEDNAQLGWAHLYSLPRELSLDANNSITQKPYEGLNQLRSSVSYIHNSNKLSGTVPLNPVSGKMVEIEASYAMNSVNIVGFNLRKKDGNKIRIYYDRNRNTLSVDARDSDRLINDNGSFNGLYESALPERMFQTLNLHIYMDHSIMDIFVNDKWAFSIRIFAKDIDANGVEAFSEGTEATVNSLKAWNLRPSNAGTGIDTPQENHSDISIYNSGRTIFYENAPAGASLFLYDNTGKLIKNTYIPETNGSLEVPGNEHLYLVRVVHHSFSTSKKILLPSY